MNKLSFDEIKSGDEFENLVAEYFRVIKQDDSNSIKDVEVMQKGKGPDGGIDILLTFELTDSILKFSRKWAVQCKFLNKPSTYKSDIGKINIPTLIHEYGAVGYLLVITNQAEAQLKETFERLNKNCQLGYQYEIWTGDQFIKKLLAFPDLLEQYFPDYYQLNRQ
jgi:Restriction endonuclease